MALFEWCIWHPYKAYMVTYAIVGMAVVFCLLIWG
jgi:hypothetical protein